MQSINSPSDLHAFATQPMTPNPPSPLPIFKVHLLFPLRDPDTLASSRNPESRYMTLSDGRRGHMTDEETISLGPLASQWREAWKSLTPSMTSAVVFDVNRPALDGPEGSTSKHWQSWWTDEEGYVLSVPPMEALRLVIVLATTMRVRHPTAVIKFGLTRNAQESWEKQDLRMLRQLQELSKPRTTASMAVAIP